MEVYATSANVIGKSGLLEVLAYRKSRKNDWVISPDQIISTLESKYIACTGGSPMHKMHLKYPAAVLYYDNVVMHRQGHVRYSVFQTANCRKAVEVYKTHRQLLSQNGVLMDVVQHVADVNAVLEDTRFYIQQDGTITGPFFLDNKGSVSTRGTRSAYCWKLNMVNLLPGIKGRTYLLTKPNPRQGTSLYAYTTDEVAEWFNRKVSSGLKLSSDQTKELRRMMRGTSSSEDKYVVNKLVDYLDRINLIPQQFAMLLSSSSEAQDWARANLESIAGLLSKEVSDLQLQKTILVDTVNTLRGEASQRSSDNQRIRSELESQYNDLRKRSEEIQTELYAEQQRLEDCRRECEELEEFNALLQDEYDQGREDEYRDYTRELVASKDAEPSVKDEDFEDQLSFYCETVLATTLDHEVLVNCLSALRSSYCLVTPKIGFAAVIGWGSANSIIYTATARYDWLNFSQFKDHIFGRVLREAKAKPRQLILLELRSFNNSSPAYLSPLLDHLRMKTGFIPGTQEVWPTNLRLILVPTSSVGEAATGLPISLEIFENLAAGVKLYGTPKSNTYPFETDYTFSADFFKINRPEPEGWKILKECCYG